MGLPGLANNLISGGVVTDHIARTQSVSRLEVDLILSRVQVITETCEYVCRRKRESEREGALFQVLPPPIN